MRRHRAHRSLIGGMPHRRGVRRAGLFLLILGLFVAGTVVYLTRPGRLADMVGKFLSDLTGAQTHIKAAWIRLDGTIELQDVMLTVPGMSEHAGKLFEARNVVIRHDVLSLIQGRFEARNLTFIDPVLYLARDLGTDKFNFESLRAVRNADYRVSGVDGLTRVPQNLPNIFIRNGQIVMGELAQGQFNIIGNSTFNGSLSADTASRNLYYFSLRQIQQNQGMHPFLAGYLNVNTLEVEASLKGLDFDEPAMRNLLPTPIREWWDQLAPTGKVPNVNVGYDPDIGLFGVLDVSDVALTLPYTENKSRMTVQSGRFKVSGQQILIENLIGKIEDFTYKINGKVHGLSPDAPFTLNSIITGKISPQPRYAPWFGHQVRKAFDDLSPTGDLEVAVSVERKTPGGAFSYKGNIDIRDASICYTTFPYPLTNVRGLIRFDDQKVELINFRGHGPSGSSLNIKCKIIYDPVEDAGITAQVAGFNMPIDDSLYNALAPKHRGLIDNLFSRERYAQMTDETDGLSASSTQQHKWLSEREAINFQLAAAKIEPDQREVLELKKQIVELKLKRPVFDLGGKTNMYLTLQRSLGEDVRNIIDARYELQGVNVLLKKWPYPMQLSGGVFTLGPDGGTLQDATMHGLRGGEAAIHGKMHWKYFGDKKKLLPEIKFTGSSFPVDEIVINSLGDRGKGILDSLGVNATIDAAGMVLANDLGKPYPAMQIRVRDGKAQPFGGNFVINDLTGYIAVQDKDVQITQITGKHEKAIFHLSGKVPKDKPVDLTFSGENVQLTPTVLDLIPPSANKRDDAHRIIDPLKLTGHFDMALRLFSDGNGTPWKSQLRLSPRDLHAVVRDQTIKLSQMKGYIDVVGDQIKLHELICQYGNGQATVSGLAELSKIGSPKLALSIDARNDELCETTRALLPSAVVKSLDALKINGKYHLQKAKLIYHPKSAKEASSFEFDGQVYLTDTTAMLGVPIKQMTGTMNVSVIQQGTEDRLPKVKLDLNLDRLLAADRLISPLKVQMDNHSANGQVLFIQQFSGHCYNGLLHGQGQIALDDSTAFMLRLTLQNADYQPMIYPDKPRENKSVEDALVRPTLSADLTISGLEKQSKSYRSGRGSIAIANANIYQFPLTMSIVQLLNLTTPTARQFNAADIRFLIDGNLINIEHVELMSPTISIAGNGRLKYDTQALDLNMYTRNPGAPNFGPVSELMKMFKNELVGIHVGGTLEKPVATVKSLGGIKQTMSEILGKRSEKKGPSQTTDLPSTSGQ